MSNGARGKRGRLAEEDFQAVEEGALCENFVITPPGWGFEELAKLMRSQGIRSFYRATLERPADLIVGCLPESAFGLSLGGRLDIFLHEKKISKLVVVDDVKYMRVVEKRIREIGGGYQGEIMTIRAPLPDNGDTGKRRVVFCNMDPCLHRSDGMAKFFGHHFGQGTEVFALAGFPERFKRRPKDYFGPAVVLGHLIERLSHETPMIEMVLLRRENTAAQKRDSPLAEQRKDLLRCLTGHGVNGVKMRVKLAVEDQERGVIERVVTMAESENGSGLIFL